MVGRMGGLVGWVLAPSTGRLPREGGSLEGAAPSRGRTTVTETNGRRYIGQQPATKSARGPAAKPLVNRLSTGGQPFVLFLHRFTLDFLCSCLLRDVQNNFLRHPGGLEGRLPSGPTEMSAPCSAQLRPAPPPAVRRLDPTRVWCVRVLDSTSYDIMRSFVPKDVQCKKISSIF